MKTLYSRRSGGVSKTLIFADFVTLVLAPALGLLVETGVIEGRWGYIALGVTGLVTRFLRQFGPAPKAKRPARGEARVEPHVEVTRIDER